MHAINGYNTLTRIHGICMSNYTIKKSSLSIVNEMVLEFFF